MAFKNEIKGLNKVLKNLNREVVKIKGNTLKGMIRGGIFVLRDVELTSPMTPVDIGNLRASRFLASSTGGVSMGRSPSFKTGGKGVKEKLEETHTNVLEWAKSKAMAAGKPTVLFGFSAYYAAPVHEMSGMVNWTRPGSGPKYFEKAIHRNIKNMLTVMRKEAKIK